MASQVNKTNKIRIERIWSMPNSHTFQIPPIKSLLDEEVNPSDFWIDPFANNNKIAAVTNDLNPECSTNYHLDALDFLKLFEDASVDGVLYDPPFSPRQVSECYNNVGYTVTWDTTKASFWGNHKREISRIVKIGGKVITFGWNSGGIGYKYGFEIQRILLVPHGGWHNDTICTVEIKTHQGTYRPKKESDTDEPETIMLTKNDTALINEFKNLPLDYWDFKEADIKEYTHGLHNYPAMMVSPISRNILRIVKQIRPVHALLDPFAGSGTVLVEGMLSGLDLVAGNDINPLALLLEKVKTTPLDHAQLTFEADNLLRSIQAQRVLFTNALQSVDEYIINTLNLDVAAKKPWGDNAPKYLNAFCTQNNVNIFIPDFQNIGYWFRPRVILELSIIKTEIDKIANINIRDFFYIALSECIRFVSNRRTGEFKMFRMPVAKVQTFNPDVFNEFCKILNRNITKMEDFCTALNRVNVHTEVHIYNNNSCDLVDIPNNTYDLVITSPPYGDSRTTVAYGEYSRLSLQWINLFNLTQKEITGIDRSLMGGQKYRNGFELTLASSTLHESLERIKDIDLERAGDVFSFYKDLDASIRNVAEKTASGGYQFWVIGNRTVKNEVLKTDVIITELAKQYGLTHIYTVDRNIPNKVMPSRNSPTNVTGAIGTTMTMEHIIILRKN